MVIRYKIEKILDKRNIMKKQFIKKEQKDQTCELCDSSQTETGSDINWKKTLTTISGLALIAGLLLSWLKLSDGSVINALYYLSIFSGGYFVAQSAIRGLLKQHFLNINFLVTIASLGALYINQLGEAASVIFFFSLAEIFEEYGIERSRKALESLISRSPKKAILLSGEEKMIDTIEIGEVVIVRPGDLIPLDGLVVKGSSTIDESTITGESIPKDKRDGNSVFAGTLNQNGYLEIKVTKESKDSTFSKIVALVDQAQRSRAPAQEFIDRFAKYYTPSVVVVALLTATIPPLFLGGVFAEWFYRALVLLVIACPCALVISAPVAIASAIGGASKRGVLIKGGKYLEALGKIKAVAFDKTGTLTIGEPYISDVVAFNGFSPEEVVADAAGIECFSSHPLSQSILSYAQEKGITPHLMDKYQNIAGKGGTATCLVCDDLEHCVGNLKLIGEKSVTSREILAKTETLEKEGKTVVLVSKGNQVMGAIAIADKIRPESKEVISTLKSLSIATAMLTGDNVHTAEAVAKKLNVTTVYASLLPDHKVKKIEELKEKYIHVAMVGDGVNDAPSLATSTVGIAMGVGGSDVAIETADVALMNSNLLNIPEAIELGRRTMKTIQQNVAVALGVKAVFLVLALTGFTHLEYAISADSGVAILVIVNSLRLFKA